MDNLLIMLVVLTTTLVTIFVVYTIDDEWGDIVFEASLFASPIVYLLLAVG